MTATAGAEPEVLSARPLRRRLIELAAVVLVLGLVIVVGPGLGTLRSRIADASPGLLVVAVALEVLSALSYVVLFRAVFCPTMSWGLSYQIGMAEQAANSLLSVSGAGGLALGAWALRRGGMSTDHIARRSVAFFCLTSLANTAGVVLFAVLYATGALGHDPDPGLTYGFGAAALAVTVFVLLLPPLLASRARAARALQSSGRLRSAAAFARRSLVDGIRDAVELLRSGSPAVIGGSVGFAAFDIAVLAACFAAVGTSPRLGVIVLGYLIGQLGGSLPVPGGIGGVDFGLIAVFSLYGVPVAPAAAAVLIYHTIALWVPAALGSIAFMQLRNRLRRESEPARICLPLADPVEVALPASRT